MLFRSQKGASLDLATTVACLQGMHAVLAHWGGPHWLLSDDDAKQYALAVNNVARHYDIAVAQKTIDIANLVGMVAFIEGTRVLYSRRPPQPRQGPMGSPVTGQVFQFTPPGASPIPPATVPPATAEPFGPTLPDTPEGSLH